MTQLLMRSAAFDRHTLPNLTLISMRSARIFDVKSVSQIVSFVRPACKMPPTRHRASVDRDDAAGEKRRLLLAGSGVQPFVTTSIENPYQAPQTVAPLAAPDGDSALVDWKAVLRRWEKLRLPYNGLVGLAGLLGSLLFPPWFWPRLLVGAFIFGLCANVMYLLGPALELYAYWFVESWGKRVLPRWVVGFVVTRNLTSLLFVAGTLFSMALTLAIAMAEAFALAFPDQP